MLRRALPFAPLLLLGCGLLTFSVEESATTTVDGAGLLGEVLGALDFTGLDDFDVAIEQKLQDQGVEPGDLDTVTLSVLRLSADPDLSFLSRMDIYVSAPGVDEVLVASGDSFPEGQSSVDLAVTGANLADAVAAGGITFRVDASGSAPVDDTDVDVYVKADVEATVQGACNSTKR